MTIAVTLTAEVFRRFTLFDTFRRRKMWRSPAIFAAILCSCALVCYAMHHVDGAVMLGTVLLIVGLGMPITYFLSFFLSLRSQCKTQGLPKQVYTLCLTQSAKGIAIDNGREHADYAWKDVFHVYRDKDATYLFMAPNRAFILPHACLEEGPDALWALLTKKLPAGKRTMLK